ncbi:unnamed protein product [Prunus brigantina]
MLVVVVGMWCSSLLCADQRTMLGHRRFSLSDSELKWNASQGSFYCCLCVPPTYSLLVSALVWLAICLELQVKSTEPCNEHKANYSFAFY